MDVIDKNAISLRVMTNIIANFSIALTALLYALSSNAQIDYRKAIEADKVHSMLIGGQQVKGQGIIIALIDTGVTASHPDLKGKLYLGESAASKF